MPNINKSIPLIMMVLSLIFLSSCIEGGFDLEALLDNQNGNASHLKSCDIKNTLQTELDNLCTESDANQGVQDPANYTSSIVKLMTCNNLTKNISDTSSESLLFGVGFNCGTIMYLNAQALSVEEQVSAPTSPEELPAETETALGWEDLIEFCKGITSKIDDYNEKCS